MGRDREALHARDEHLRDLVPRRRGGAGPYWIVENTDELRESGAYLVLTPDQLTDHLRAAGYMMLHPLCGGIPPELAWETLRTIETKVLPAR